MTRGASPGERIVTRLLEEEMQESFLDYSMSVIVQRALPDARDGLKPVHRRILYAMYELGLLPERAYKKSATVVGDVLGKYHPHGDTAVYDALVRMAQDFSLRMPLIDGQGNFGSVDGDPAAAYRYTEARLASIAVELIDDVRKATVGFQPNFDGSNREPVVLPGRFPNLLVNGSAGIAVGMSTNVPPHNLREIAAGVRQLAIDPDCTVADLMRHIPGPDFPTGGFIVGNSGIRTMYEEGRGRVPVRARVVKETHRGGKEQLVVTELPYGVSKGKVIEQIARAAKSGGTPAISDVRDESDRDGMRLVMELKRGSDAADLLAGLYRRTSLRVTFGAQLLALDRGEPKIFTLKGLLEAFRDHRLEVLRRRARHDLEEARIEEHVVEGLLAALARIDEVVRTIRSSENRKQAAERLQELLALSEAQAGAILDMRLAKLTALEGSQLRARLETLVGKIAALGDLLASEELQLEAMLEELWEVVESHGDARRTVILEADEAVDAFRVEEQLADEDVVVTITRQGFVKRIPMHIYRRRTASGKALVREYADDHLDRALVARTQGRVVAFSERGRCFVLPVSEIPESSATTRGKSIYALLEGASRDDPVVAAAPAGEIASDERAAVMVTRGGMVKRTKLSEFANARTGGVIAAGLREGDRLLDVRLSGGGAELLVISRRGRAIRFAESDVSLVGRTAMGVKAMTLAKGGDEVLSMLFAHNRGELLTVTRNGWSRRTAVTEFPLQRRGGLGTLVGVREDDLLVAALERTGSDSILLATAGGETRTVSVASVPLQSRRARGHQVFKPALGDYVERVADTHAEESAAATDPTAAERGKVPARVDDDEAREGATEAGNATQLGLLES